MSWTVLGWRQSYIPRNLKFVVVNKQIPGNRTPMQLDRFSFILPFEEKSQFSESSDVIILVGNNNTLP